MSTRIFISEIFEAYGLVAGNDDGLVDVLGEAASREVVHRRRQTLQNRAYGLHAAEALHQLVGDVAHFQRGEHQHVCASAEGAVGGFAVCHGGHDGGVGLEFAVEDEFGVEFAGQFGGADNLVHAVAFRRAFGGERQQRHAGCDAGDVACGACGGHGNLGELLGGGVGHHGAVGEHQHAFASEGRTFRQQHHERAGYHADAGNGLDYLEGGAEHVAGGVHCTCHLAVGIAGFHHKAAQIEGIGSGEARFFHAYALALAQFVEKGSVAFHHGFVGGVDYGGLADVLELELAGHGADFGLVADEDNLCEAVGDYAVGGGECAGLEALGEHYALGVFPRFIG